VIRKEGLTKRYPGVTAVDRLTLDLPAGSVVGVVGPNGAGKTTLLRLLLGITRPSAGSATVLGHPLADSLAIRRAVGLVPDSKSLYHGTDVAGFLRFHAAFYPSAEPSAAESLLARWGVDPSRSVVKLSRGERTKVLLAAVLARQAPLTLLDEPSDGLDPGAIEDLWSTLLDDVAGREGSGVVLCTHRLDEVERLCDRIVVMQSGSLALEGELDELRSRWRRLIVRFDGQQAPATIDGMRSLKSRNGLLEAVTSSWDGSLPHGLIGLGELVEALPMSLRDIYLTAVGHDR